MNFNRQQFLNFRREHGLDYVGNKDRLTAIYLTDEGTVWHATYMGHGRFKLAKILGSIKR